MDSIHGKYLGESDVTEQTKKFLDPQTMALGYIEMYGGIDGEHHKAWVLDQVARILNGAPITVMKACWEDGYSEIRYYVGSCDRYKEWVAGVKDGEDGPDSYPYDTGIAP